MCNKEITQIYLPPTHEPCLPFLPTQLRESDITLRQFRRALKPHLFGRSTSEVFAYLLTLLPSCKASLLFGCYWRVISDLQAIRIETRKRRGRNNVRILRFSYSARHAPTFVRLHPWRHVSVNANENVFRCCLKVSIVCSQFGVTCWFCSR